MTKELAELILKHVEEKERMGCQSFYGDDIIDIVEEAKEKGIPCGKQEMIEAGFGAFYSEFF